MPRGDPFSQLCQLAASLTQPVAADLHTHTLASDGDYTPSQVLAFAQAAKLKAVAITDHDTLAGYDEARTLNFAVRLVPGVEISVLWNDRETHLLAYGFDPDNVGLRAMLGVHCNLRRLRLRELADALRDKGIVLDIEPVLARTPSVGRGNLAKLLSKAGHSPREVFAGIALPRTPFTDIATATAIVQQARGIVSLAHPRDELTRNDFEGLRFLGVDAVEVFHPSVKLARRAELAGWAGELGMLVTGGSDCHGPGTPVVGSCGVRNTEWARLVERFHKS